MSEVELVYKVIYIIHIFQFFLVIYFYNKLWECGKFSKQFTTAVLGTRNSNFMYIGVMNQPGTCVVSVVHHSYSTCGECGASFSRCTCDECGASLLLHRWWVWCITPAARVVSVVHHSCCTCGECGASLLQQVWWVWCITPAAGVMSVMHHSCCACSVLLLALSRTSRG